MNNFKDENMKNQLKEKVKTYFDKNYINYISANWNTGSKQIKFLKEKAISGRFLDIGCGSGSLSSIILKETGIEEYIGFDISHETLKSSSFKITKIQGDAEFLPFKSNSFEIVYTYNLLHHLIGKSRKESKIIVLNVLNEICRVVKKDGYIFISDIFYDGHIIPEYVPVLIFYLLKFLPRSILKFLDKDYEKNLRTCFFSSREWKNLIEIYAKQINFQWKISVGKNESMLRKILLKDCGEINYIFNI
jgi:ubiquinone/menaquinone biosynthesis C-methylase UbiE